MRKLLRNLILLGLLVFAINWVVTQTLPFFWGESDLREKYTYFDNHAAEFNTLFLGSSRTFRHISPAVFEETVAANGMEGIHAFNFGLPAFFPPQTHLLFENLLADHGDQLDYVFIELSPLTMVPAEANLHTREMIYWYNPQYTWFLLRSLWADSNTAVQQKLKGSFFHLMNLTEKALNAGLGLQIVDYFVHDHGEMEPSVYALGPDLNGFLALDQQIALYPEISHTVRKRHADYLKNPQVLNGRTQQANKAFTAYSAAQEACPSGSTDCPPYNAVHLAEVERLLALAEQHGVHLVFILPPRLGRNGYDELLPVFYHIPREHRVELANPKTSVRFYRTALSFDIGHMTSEGAAIYSRRLANQFGKNLAAGQ